MKKNLFKHILKEKEPEKESFEFIPGDLLPEVEKKSNKSTRFNIKTLIYIGIMVLIVIFCISLLSANSNQSNKTESDLFLLQESLAACTSQQSTSESQISILQSQLDMANNKIYPLQKECKVSDCLENTYTNTYNNTNNLTYIQSLKKEIVYLEGLTNECYEMNTTINNTVRSDLRACKRRLERIENYLED